MYESKTNIRNIVLIPLFACIIGIMAQITIPLPLVPITGQTLAIGLASTILGLKKSTYSVILYCILGAIGIPVFAELNGGLHILVGPTGGYIIGFIPTAFITGYLLEKFGFKVFTAIIANTVGMVVTLLFGMTWLKISSDLSWTNAFISGFLPFVIVGILKAYLASAIGIAVRNHLIQANMLILDK